jgi:hypothetical protein
VAGADEHCLLISQVDDANPIIDMAPNVLLNSMSTNRANNQKYSLILTNSIGTRLDTKYINIEPIHWTINSSYAIVTSRSYIYIWHYSTGGLSRGALKKQSSEKLIFVDNPNAAVQLNSEDSSIVSVGSIEVKTSLIR